MRPPLFTFLTFNRLGNTIFSLKSILESVDDFELYLLDNFSQDNTWEYLNSINDPRIVDRKRFESNYGVAALNYALSFRKEDQDWINVEPDTLIHNKSFITIFQNTSLFFPEFGYFSGMLFKENEMTDFYIKKTIEAHPESIIQRNTYKIFNSPVGMTGYCLYIPYLTMNELMFLDEVSCGADVEMNSRILNVLKKKAGFVFNIECEMIGIDCSICPVLGNICTKENICKKMYSKVYHDFILKNRNDAAGIIQKIKNNEIPVRCNSIFGKNMLLEEQRISRENIAELKLMYQEYLSKI
jgi:hypothetical protein